MRLVLVLAGQTQTVKSKQMTTGRPASSAATLIKYKYKRVCKIKSNQIKSNETCGSIDMHACLLVRGIHPPIIYLFNLLIAINNNEQTCIYRTRVVCVCEEARVLDKLKLAWTHAS